MSKGILMQGAYELIHTDVEFGPKFEKCKYCDGPCEPEIENEAWQDYAEGHTSNGGYGLLKEESFMVCLKGYGLLYITEDGQRLYASKRRFAQHLIQRGDRRLLGRFMGAAFGGDPVNMSTGNFIFARTDLEVKGLTPLIFQRFYNTFNEEVTPLGKGWHHPYGMKLTPNKEEVTIKFEDGHEERYQIRKKATSSANQKKIGGKTSQALEGVDTKLRKRFQPQTNRGKPNSARESGGSLGIASGNAAPAL